MDSNGKNATVRTSLGRVQGYFALPAELAKPPHLWLSTLFSSSSSSSLPALLSSPLFWLTLLILYLSLCRALRFRRATAMRRKFNYPDRASLVRMTHDDAQAIVKYLMLLEFPTLYLFSLQFAILKTYGFKSMTALMASTKTFLSTESAPKRYEDTSVIFGLFQLYPPVSDISLKAISRMNYLHSRYTGRISNNDFLYTLSVCITQPIRFMKLYEWRELSDMEVAAVGTFWKGIGEAMNIDYCAALGKDGWKDGLEFVEDISAWAARYELEAMKPAKTNRQLAESLNGLLLQAVPRFAKPFLRECIVALLGDRLREAFMFPEPSLTATVVVHAILLVHRFLMRYLALPRYTEIEYFSLPDPTTGRIRHFDYLVEPWYQPATWWTMWGPGALVKRALGIMLPGCAKELLPQGFLFEDLGPKHLMGKGVDEMRENEEFLRAVRTGGCPFGHGS